ncbi:TetR/AcrR family transcriptional regulator [Aldersonia kunmingensis]|uniref:TetR/AcrR family transcriptional regulator n=1 Tax=Aldersonia kunmingensis TaxID=408066 RepID=UPI00082CC59B|nr:TetR/AcrR family transcriptional regulator [Aldersonia kunmingensis]
MKTTRSYTQTTRADSKIATRERITQTASELFLENTYEEVTLAGIARAAGVSHQTVLNHFESKLGVVLAVAELIGAQTTSVRYAQPGDIEAAVHALVSDYERMGDANFRWAASADRIPELAQVLDGARVGHQQWIVDMFGDRLPTEATARRHAIGALHAATDVYVWKLLRRDLKLSRSETESTIVDLVAGVLKGQ